jgi:KDO2-lipid IV(A) lauroyltransferase
MSRWKLFRYRLEVLGCKLLSWGIPRLSRRRCVRLANLVGDLAYRFDWRSRNIALSNLECVFGDALSPTERSRLAAASFRNFAGTMLDLFWVQSLTRENHSRWLSTVGLPEIQERMARERVGTIFMCAHHGNWEMASAALGFGGTSNVTLTENFKNPGLTAIFSAAREAPGHRVIGQGNSILRILRAVARGESVGILIDLSVPPDQAATITNCFGLTTCHPMLHAAISQRTGALLVPLEAEPLEDGRFKVWAHPPLKYPPDASPHEVAQICWDFFEPIIRKRPWEYLWSYKHFRYAPKDASRPYPSYANTSSKFEKLLRSLSKPHQDT